MAEAAQEQTAWLVEDDIKAVVAELVGTFVFVFVGAGSVITANGVVSSGPSLGLLLAALGNGLGLGIAVTAVGHVSGGHLNPAVTIALWVSQRIATVLAGAYILAQLAGGILAALALKAIFSPGIWEPVHLGAPSLSSTYQVSFGTGVLLEAIMAFFLTFVVFGTAVDPRHARIGGLGIGLVVLVDNLVGGPLTGAAMNPARAFGPALTANFWGTHWTDHLAYWIGPILGAIIASLIYGYILMPHEDIDIGSAPAVPGSDIAPVPAPETNPYLESEIEEGGETDEMPAVTEPAAPPESSST